MINAGEIVSRLLPPGKKLRIVELRRQFREALVDVEQEASKPLRELEPLLAALDEYIAYLDCERDGDPKQLFDAIRKAHAKWKGDESWDT